MSVTAVVHKSNEEEVKVGWVNGEIFHRYI